MPIDTKDYRTTEDKLFDMWNHPSASEGEKFNAGAMYFKRTGKLIQMHIKTVDPLKKQADDLAEAMRRYQAERAQAEVELRRARERRAAQAAEKARADSEAEARWWADFRARTSRTTTPPSATARRARATARARNARARTQSSSTSDYSGRGWYREGAGWVDGDGRYHDSFGRYAKRPRP